MSSLSRPERCWVWAVSRVYGDPAIHGREVEVVGGEVLDDADVGDARGERALARRGDLVDVAEQALLDPLAHRQDGRVAALDVADAADHAGLLEGGADPLPRLDGVGDRLLDHGGDAGGGQRERDVLVVHGRHRDDGGVEPGGDQGVHVGEDRQVPRHAELVTHRVGDGDQLHAGGRADDPRVVAAHRAQPDDADAQRPALGRHHAPAFTTVLTAATMRSRSPWDSDGCTGSESTSAAARSVSGRSSPGANLVSDSRRWLGIG